MTPDPAERTERAASLRRLAAELRTLADVCDRGAESGLVVAEAEIAFRSETEPLPGADYGREPTGVRVVANRWTATVQITERAP